MSDSPRKNANLVDKVVALQDQWEEVETFLQNLVQGLIKRGLKLSIDVDGITRTTRQMIRDTREQAQLAQEQMSQLQELIQESAVITSTLELDQVLEHIMDTVINLTGAERAYLMLRAADHDELTIRIARNWNQEDLQEKSVFVVYSRSVVDLAISQGKPVITTNAQRDDRFQGAASVADMNLLLILCIPLMLRGQVVGVLYADSHIERGIFHEDMVPLLSAFATQAAIAIKNASEFGEVKNNLQQALKENQELRIQIDIKRVSAEVDKITESDYFQELTKMVDQLRAEGKANRK